MAIRPQGGRPQRRRSRAAAASSWCCWLPAFWSRPRPALWCSAAATPSRISSVFLALLATVGVFSLFAFASGILRLSAAEAANPLIKSRGRSKLSTASWSPMATGGSCMPMRPISISSMPPTRTTCGRSNACSSAMPMRPRRSTGCSRRRARESACRRKCGSPATKGRPARWLRLRVRPLGEGGRARRLTVWSLST